MQVFATGAMQQSGINLLFVSSKYNIYNNAIFHWINIQLWKLHKCFSATVISFALTRYHVGVPAFSLPILHHSQFVHANTSSRHHAIGSVLSRNPRNTSIASSNPPAATRKWNLSRRILGAPLMRGIPLYDFFTSPEAFWSSLTRAGLKLCTPGCSFGRFTSD